jgi:hypothetical protein
MNNKLILCHEVMGIPLKKPIEYRVNQKGYWVKTFSIIQDCYCNRFECIWRHLVMEIEEDVSRMFLGQWDTITQKRQRFYKNHFPKIIIDDWIKMSSSNMNRQQRIAAALILIREKELKDILPGKE